MKKKKKGALAQQDGTDTEKRPRCVGCRVRPGDKMQPFGKEILGALPPANYLYDEGGKLLDESIKELEKHPDILPQVLKDINRNLKRHSEHRGIKMERDAFPDPEKLSRKITKFLQALKREGLKEKTMIIKEIEIFEATYANMAAGMYGAALREAQRHGASLKGLPHSRAEFIDFLHGILHAIEKHNKKGHLDHLYREVGSYARHSGINDDQLNQQGIKHFVTDVVHAAQTVKKDIARGIEHLARDLH